MTVTLHGPDGAGQRRADEPEAPRPETPTERVVNAANQVERIPDANGRMIGFKRLGMMDSWDLEALAGAQLSANEAWMSKAMLAYAVVEIDGKRVPRPNTMRELRAVFQRLGDTGMVALLVHLSAAAAEQAKVAEQARLAEIGDEGGAGPDGNALPAADGMAQAKN